MYKSHRSWDWINWQPEITTAWTFNIILSQLNNYFLQNAKKYRENCIAVAVHQMTTYNVKGIRCMELASKHRISSILLHVWNSSTMFHNADAEKSWIEGENVWPKDLKQKKCSLWINKLCECDAVFVFLRCTQGNWYCIFEMLSQNARFLRLI